MMCQPRSAARIVARFWVVLLTCFLISPVQGAIRDGGINPSNLGKGEWIYQMNQAVGGYVPSVTNVTSLMIYLKNQGVRYIIVKAGTGAELFGVPGFNPQFTSSLVDQAHAAGLWIFGYNRSFATNTAGEVAIADYVFQQGADGFVWDAEAEWESSRIGTQGPELAIAQCSQVRSNWPSKFLAHSPFAYITGHSSFPYKEFGYYCDAVMPQDYWVEFGETPTAVVTKMSTQWRNWQNTLTGKWVSSIKPLVPAGQGYNGSGTVTAAQITEFVTALKNDANPATAGGYKGVNYFKCEGHPADIWDAVRTNNITVFTNAPVIANVSDGNVTANSATITWTTDQSSDSVVEYSLDLSYGSAVTNTTPIYYHTAVLSGLSASTTYHYRVKSRNSNNQTGVSADYVFTTEAVTVSDVIVESYLAGPTLNSNPPYLDSQFVGTPSSCKSSASGLIGPAAARYATGGGGSSPSVTLRPTLPVAGGTYDVYLTHCSASSVSPDIVATVGQTSCSGLPATTTVFQSAGANTWELVGRMTLNAGVTVPTVSFTRSGGTLSATARMYSDGYKFVYVPPPPLPPSIATQPQSQTNNQGNSATFSVVAAGTPMLFYQWRFNGTNIGGATLSSYTRHNIQAADAGSYSVTITNGVGSTNSANALLTVIVPPTILVQPADTGAGSGMNATFSVTAVGTGTLQYQWRSNGTNISGATASSYTVSDVQPSKAGPYDVVVSSPYGTNVSETAFLSFRDPCISTQPQSQSVAAGGTAVFNASAVGSPTLTYQWMKAGVNLADGGNISGAQTPSLTVANVQWEDMGNYSMVVSNGNGWDVSLSAALVAPFRPGIVTQPTSQTVSASAAATFTVGAIGQGTLTFQWKRDGTNLANGSKFSGVTNASLVVAKAQAADMRNYSVVVGNTYGDTVSSNAVLALWPLAGWGHNVHTQADIPPELTSVAGVAGGLYHSLVLKADGTVTAWGAGWTNSGLNPHYGQTIVPGGLADVVGLAGGAYHSLALKADGTVAAWGAGTSYTGASPHYGQAIVPPAATGIAAIAAGAYHSLALKSNGTVVAWGAGTNTGSSPHFGQCAVPAGLSNVVAIAAGVYHSLALKSDGTVVAWGAGTSYTGSTPEFGQSQVPAGLSDVVAIAGGGYHSLALKADGTVTAWGAGTNDTGGSPDFGQAQVPGGVTNVAALAAGFYHSLALKADGTVVAWGYNNNGQTNTPGPLANGVAVAAGGYHSLAVEGDGAPWFAVQPVSRLVASGTTVKLAAIATGVQPMSYQWRCNGTNVPGATGAVLALPEVQIVSAGTYSVVVSNTLGTATSANAILTVIAPPTITANPQSLLINQGSNATFTVTAVGTPPLSYQWRFNGTNISGATATAYTRASAEASDAGSYSVMVTNSLGSATSLTATLSFNVPPGITTQPQSVMVVAGSNVTFAVIATGTAPLAYQWVFAGTNIADATASSYTRNNAQPDDAGSYAVMVSNVAGSVTSSNAVLTVNVPPAITAQPQDVSAAPGSNVTFAVTATGTAPLDYQWRFNGTNIAGASVSSYTRVNAQAADAGSYSVVISNLAGTVTSAEAMLAVVQPVPPRIDSISLTAEGRAQLQVSGAPGHYAVDGASNLTDWAELARVTNSGSGFQYLDPETGLTERFYRVRLVP